MTWSTECCSQSIRIVMRLRDGSCVVPTASESMLNPRRANSPAQRVSTPGRFSTRTDRVWWLTSDSLFDPGVVVVGPLHVDHLGGGAAGGHHRVDLLLVVDAGVDHTGGAALERRGDGRVHLLERLAPEAGQVGIEQRLGVALTVEQLLPLAHHA